MEIIEEKNISSLQLKGKFGEVSKGVYLCKYENTIHSDVNNKLKANHPKDKSILSEKMYTRSFCKKTPLK